MVEPAALALKPRHTSLEDAAEQELPKLALHELWQPAPSPASATARRNGSKCSAMT